MKNLVFGALIAGLAVACGGGGGGGADTGIIIPTDGGGDGSGPMVCNPGAQTGCQQGEKCTWVRVAASPTQQLGQLGCVPEGTAQLDAQCTYGAVGVTTGYDTCARGLICLASSSTDMAQGLCRSICDFTAVSGATGACSEDFACSRYSRFFSNTSMEAPIAGICDPTCNPLTQVRATDNAAACGSPDPADPAAGCYGLPSFDATETSFSCSGSGDPAKVHRVPAADMSGVIYLNGCAPGYMPYLYESSTSMITVCTAICQPLETYTGMAAGAKGMMPYRCNSTDLQGTFGPNEECRFWWWFEAGETPLNQWSNSIGVCLDFSKYTYDDDNMANTPEVGYPSCSSLVNTDTSNPPNMTPEHIEWGCGPYPEEPMMFAPTGKKNVPNLRPAFAPAEMLEKSL